MYLNYIIFHISGALNYFISIGISFQNHFSLTWVTFFTTTYNKGWFADNDLSLFFFTWNVFISPLYLKDIFTDYTMGWQFYFVVIVVLILLKCYSNIFWPGAFEAVVLCVMFDFPLVTLMFFFNIWISAVWRDEQKFLFILLKVCWNIWLLNWGNF